MKEIYLDNSATTRVCRESAAAMEEIMEIYGNPSSLHHLGLKAEKKMEEARTRLSGILRVDPGEIIFTSGGTESINLAVKGAARRHVRRGSHIITTAIEHPATLMACRSLENEGFHVDFLPVDEKGNLNLEVLEKKVRRDTVLVSAMHVNNEVGSILPLEAMGQILKTKNPAALFHVDAVQSFCKLSCRPRQWQADLVSISSHKVHGPKGVGALYKKEDVAIEPLFHGGGQEKGIRPGTENTAGIVGFAAAAVTLEKDREKNCRHMGQLKERLVAGILSRLPRVFLNGPREGAPHIANFTFEGVKGEVLLHSLEAEGIYVSTGSACHSRHPEPSHVLKALGRSHEEIQGSLRFSLSPFNTREDIDCCLTRVESLVGELRQLL